MWYEILFIIMIYNYNYEYNEIDMKIIFNIYTNIYAFWPKYAKHMQYIK